MVPWSLLVVLISLAESITQPVDPADAYAADAKACAAMDGKRFGGGLIVAATFARPPYPVRWINPRVATVGVPFCRLEGYANPVPRSHIQFEVWLPARAAWNGKFLGVGAGGSLGDVNRPDMAAGANRGFAVVATDNGHRSPSPRDDIQWALNEPQRVIDFGHRGQHIATGVGKAAAEHFYGRKPQYSYYYGCSQGGQKAMMAAQRYPDDYDGIVAGAPVYSWLDEMTQQAWTVHALTETPRSALTVSQMQALQDAATARCAGPHGLVGDPRRCAFDPAELECPRADGECLAPEQVAAVRRIYSGPATSDGKQIMAGFSRGGERGWEQLYAMVSADGLTGGGSWLGVYRYMVFDDPHWTLDRMNFDRDPLYARQKVGPVLHADDPDLDRFAGHGGKLLVFHGWADQQVPAASSVAYREAVVARSTAQRVAGYFRLFMVPGMAHCLPESVAPSSPAPTGPNLVLLPDQERGITVSPQNDALAAVQAWVEEGIAPAQFVVRVRNDAARVAARSVLACAEPGVPVWRGTGDPLDATQWVCRQP